MSSGTGNSTPQTLAERFVGAVIRRRSQELPTATADQKLLDHSYGKDWKDEDPGVLRIQAEFVEGFDALAGPAPRSPCSARPAPSPGARLRWPASRSAGSLAEAGCDHHHRRRPGRHGGGQQGRVEAGGLSIGLGIELPFEQA